MQMRRGRSAEISIWRVTGLGGSDSKCKYVVVQIKESVNYLPIVVPSNLDWLKFFDFV